MAYEVSRRGALFGAAGAGAAVALSAASARAAARPRVPPVLLTEQASKRILVLDPRRPVWDLAADPEAVLWSCSPLGDPQYADLDPAASWVYPSEAKVRRLRGRTYVLTCASFGFAAVVEHPTGRRYWAGELGPGDDLLNPHSVELLPDGNVAVAGSTGALVRVYAASQGPDSTTYAEAELKGAHGLHWDARRRVLWAVGDDELVAYRVGGSAGRPRLVRTFGVALPVPSPGGKAGGHDLFPVAASADRLWVATSAAVFQYVVSQGEFVRHGVSRASVKAVGDDPRSGRVITTVPEDGLEETWWTRRVDVHEPSSSYFLVDGGIYKARWWLPR
ncbi:hypothetical protein DY218_00205 [Streptomyces triticagri]|uniref:Uncharacterized protein n=1 Tax=Streptomyces triticagri TaxID=2293568 RepID=A0A372MCN3_9ACTN|nr:DUF6528 family protein [Streptomyces triticagri]RFU88669.1 hypothetical protein DY218_00205 [Streptomyces triticagri]